MTHPADPRFRTGCNVGRIVRTERKFEGAPAPEWFAAGGRVAGGATGRFGQILPLRDECGSGWLRVRGLHRLDRGRPKEEASGCNRADDTQSAYGDERAPPIHELSLLESSLRSTGRRRRLTPVASKIAFPSAGAADTVATSPRPPGPSSLSKTCTSIAEVSLSASCL